MIDQTVWCVQSDFDLPKELNPFSNKPMDLGVFGTSHLKNYEKRRNCLKCHRAISPSPTVFCTLSENFPLYS